jgi:KipI family sensor histidine kinase inhibitor
VTEPGRGFVSSGAGALAPVGDQAARFDIPNGAPRRRLLDALRAIPGVRDVVLTEDVGCVVFEGDARSSALAARELEASAGWSGDDAATTRTHEIGVVYDGEDLEPVARALGKTPEAVIDLHSGREYRVAMLGFLPGFAYLRGLPSELCLPRRAPRPRVARNSVGIAARYTGVYPFASPGGWHLLGRAVDFEAFGPQGAALAIGDAVRFVPTTGSPPPATTHARPAPATERPHLEVTRAASLALLVDRGRPGHMHEGVPPGGPLVRSGLDRANALAGNPPDACGVEVSGSLEVVARGGPVVVADEVARIDLAEGDRYVVSTEGRTRARYLAVAGGVDTPLVLGSRSTLLVAGIGALLRRGDRLVPLAPGSAPPTENAPPLPSSSDPISIMPGPDTVDGFSIDTLDGCELRISPTSDRTGTRLEGPPLREPSADAAMARPSLPMVLGAIELTPSGLIVLGPDHPTTGGYPVVAVVRAASLDSFFARPIGSTVRLSVD